MTRDEAIEKVDGLEPFDLPNRRGQNGLLVDKLVALGMLKLDEPKSITDKINDAMCESGYAFLRGDDFKRCMERHGLQIVEK